MNEILGAAARFQQLLTRKFNITGGAPSPQLTPEITPEYAINELAPEDKILCSEFIASAAVYIPAVAAKSNVVSLSNPAGSNVLLILERIITSRVAAGGTWAGIIKLSALADLPGASQVVVRDGRVNVVSNYPRKPVGDVTSFADPPTVATSNLFYVLIAANSTFIYDMPVVIPPGWSVHVKNAVVNTDLLVSFAWREIPLAPGEVGPF